MDKLMLYLKEKQVLRGKAVSKELRKI